MARWERWEDSEVARLERWEGSEVGSWERWEGSEMARWERWESSEVARWEVLGFIQGWGCRVGPRFHLFVSDVNQQNKGVGCVQDFFAWLQGWKVGVGVFRIHNHRLS